MGLFSRRRRPPVTATPAASGRSGGSLFNRGPGQGSRFGRPPVRPADDLTAAAEQAGVEWGPRLDEIGTTIPPPIAVLQSEADTALADLGAAAERAVGAADTAAAAAAGRARRARQRQAVADQRLAEADAEVAEARKVVTDQAPDRLDEGRFSAGALTAAGVIIMLGFCEILVAEQVFGLLGAGKTATRLFTTGIAVTSIYIAHLIGSRVLGRARAITAVAIIALAATTIGAAAIRANALDNDQRLLAADDPGRHQLPAWYGLLLFAGVTLLLIGVGLAIGRIRHCPPLERLRRSRTRRLHRRTLAAAVPRPDRADAKAHAATTNRITTRRVLVHQAVSLTARHQTAIAAFYTGAASNATPDIAATLADQTHPTITPPTWTTKLTNQADRIAAHQAGDHATTPPKGTATASGKGAASAGGDNVDEQTPGGPDVDAVMGDVAAPETNQATVTGKNDDTAARSEVDAQPPISPDVAAVVADVASAPTGSDGAGGGVDGVADRLDVGAQAPRLSGVVGAPAGGAAGVGEVSGAVVPHVVPEAHGNGSGNGNGHGQGDGVGDGR